MLHTVYLLCLILFNSVNEIRQFNDQMANLEKAFIDPSGISRNGFL